MSDAAETFARLKEQSWWSVLSGRRSHRFCLGMEIPSGPLKYRSRFKPVPLTEEEEAALVYAAAGFTGPALGDLSYGAGQGAGIMVGLNGRTTPSGDGIQNVGLLVVNDAGAFWIRRPQDFSAAERNELVGLCRAGNLLEFYRRVRIRLCDGRIAPSCEPLFNLNLNRWSAHAPGTTSFVPVNDITLMYLNGLLEVLGEETGACVLDERRNFLPAGVSQFFKSKGGHLKDDPADGCLVTVRHVEQLVTEFVVVEQGMMMQNLALMAEALGLGGFPSFANHEFGWFEAAGFTMRKMSASRFLGVPWYISLGMKLLGRDLEVPQPVGLSRNGSAILTPFCPPGFESVEAAVDAVVALKSGRGRLFGPGGGNPALKKPESMVGDGRPASEAAIKATKSLVRYLWDRYKRFPVYLSPYRTTLCFQAGHVDVEFYRKFYRDGFPGQRQSEDFSRATGVTELAAGGAKPPG